MATGGASEQLTGGQIARLAAAISGRDIGVIAEGYMNISSETVKNLLYENRGDTEAYNRHIIRTWRNKNPEHQVEVSYNISNIDNCCL